MLSSLSFGMPPTAWDVLVIRGLLFFFKFMWLTAKEKVTTTSYLS
jgi:hypothetical protein